MGGYFPILMFALIILFFYFFMIRPQKKQERKDAEMRDALEVGDEVTTIGGIIGKVVSIKDQTFVLETTKDKTKIRFLKGAIRSVDVKASDLAAQVIEAKAEPDAQAPAAVEAPAEDKPVAKAEPEAKPKTKKSQPKAKSQTKIEPQQVKDESDKNSK